MARQNAGKLSSLVGFDAFICPYSYVKYVDASTPYFSFNLSTHDFLYKGAETLTLADKSQSEFLSLNHPNTLLPPSVATSLFLLV